VSDEKSTVIQFPTRGRSRVVARVHELAANTFNINWTKHALERLDERGLTTRQVLSTLREGEAERDPIPDQDGDWEIILIKRSAGKLVRVVAALSGCRLYVITAT